MGKYQNFMKIIAEKKETLLINKFISIFKKESLKKSRNNKRMSFVLTGGSSPKKLYTKLAKEKIDWSNIDLFWGDERFVSSKSKNSNYNLAYNLLIKKIKINKKNIYAFDTKGSNLIKSSLKYKKLIFKYFKNKEVKFDIMLLGMGKDGHIASIFPNSKELKNKFVVKPVIRNDFKRMTLSLNIINNSNKILLWLPNKRICKIYKNISKKGKLIPVNTLNRKKLVCFKIT